METEFNLSEKIVDYKEPFALEKEVINKQDVKEFIRLLKEINFNSGYIDDDELYKLHQKEICEKIDKLAGDKLI